MDQAALVYTTWPSLVEAEAVGTALVEAGLAACVNILPGMVAVFRWQGKVERAQEVVMILKTRADHTEAVVATVKDLHPYDMPAILVLPVSGGEPGYLAWIAAEGKEQ